MARVTIRAAAVLVLLARSAWAAPEPRTTPSKPPAPAPAPAPANAPAPAPADDDPDPVVEDEPAPEPKLGPAPVPEPAPAPTPVEEPRTLTGVSRPPADMIRENSLLLDHARTARDAARSGHCVVVHDISKKVRALDPTFHSYLFVYDPLIAACLYPGAFPMRPPELVLREVRAEPPASVGRISGEILFGMVVGTGGALIGALIGGGLCIGGEESEFDRNCDASTIGGAYLGAIATIPLGVRAVGAAGDQTGSLGMTYLGSLIGGVGGLLMLANGRENVTILGMVLAPPLGAMIGFNMTRRYRPRRVPVTGALLSVGGGTASLGVPIPMRARTEDRTVTTFPLLGGTF